MLNRHSDKDDLIEAVQAIAHKKSNAQFDLGKGD